ncbi:MAG TPA: SWIM zinc finger family protein [Labilithrix sp.]|nr:SWIM zinc finger family protein [Labilithrix sp.]
MEFHYSFKGATAVDNGPYRTAMSFSPDVTREPTFFTGELRKPLAFREAMSALHDVVVSDLRFKPKDKTAYKEWAAKQELVDWDEIARQRTGNAGQLKDLQAQLSALQVRASQRMQPFYRARQKYFDWLYQKDRDAWFVLDPVITVHPDEVFFECFSQDESSYGRLSASYEVFQNIGALSCGTTNIDYSAALYDEFQKIRSYKTTKFGIDPSGFEVKTTNEEDFKEVKIDLPDSWVRGFLQVNSAMALPARSFELHPMDVHNFCFVLRRHREKLGPRSMRWHLTPGQPVRVTFDPWGTEIICRRSIYTGPDAAEIRVWGRRRLHILERLIPIARRFTVHLLGQGMPSFWVADLGDLSFTLGLSGWTANDWSASANFDLLAPRKDVDDATKLKVFQALKKDWLSTPDALVQKTGIPRAQVLGALSAWTQAGRAIFDLAKGVYRARELSREPLPLDALRFQNERESAAMRFLEARGVTVRANASADGTMTLMGNVKEGRQELHPSLIMDSDGRIVRAECSCNYFQQNQLRKGPCEHMLAIRMQHQRQVH